MEPTFFGVLILDEGKMQLFLACSLGRSQVHSPPFQRPTEGVRLVLKALTKKAVFLIR